MSKYSTWTLPKFIDKMREQRGKLTRPSAVDDMTTIYTEGSTELLDYMIYAKKIGLQLGAEIASSLKESKQDELIIWARDKQVHQVEWRLQELIDEERKSRK